MESIVVAAKTVVTLLFSEAFKEGGKALGKGVSNQVAQLIEIIYQKFQKAGTDGLIKRAKDHPTESNVAIVEAELIAQMEGDKVFSNQLQKYIEKFEQVDVLRQVMLTNIKANNIKTDDMNQKVNKSGSVTQIMGANLDVNEDVQLGNLNQEVS